jgi:hypothetical protein
MKTEQCERWEVFLAENFMENPYTHRGQTINYEIIEKCERERRKITKRKIVELKGGLNFYWVFAYFF